MGEAGVVKAYDEAGDWPAVEAEARDVFVMLESLGGEKGVFHKAYP